ncbi:MAG: FkbM family methyltransferase [Alteraurantiacibacter sp.]
MKTATKRAVYRLFDAIAPTARVWLADEVRRRLIADPLTIVDVGAVFGPDKRWSQLGERTCRFITFEPDKRSHADPDENGPFAMLALPTAIGREPGTRTLHLTKGEFASSLYPPNKAVLGAFATWPWHESAGTAEVTVDTLDNALAAFPDWRPDFIKTDIEGADLDALVGGELALASSLGMQVEVSFVERNEGAPLFAEIDQHLRARGFMLFQLIREHWLRANMVRGVAARPQLIWADAIYFREAANFGERLAAADDREGLLVKFIALLLVHGHFDTAADLVHDAEVSGHCSLELAAALDRSVLKSAQSPGFVLRGWVAVVLAGLLRLAALPFGTAAREQAREVYARKAAPLFHHHYREAMRAGLDRSCIPDLP